MDLRNGTSGNFAGKVGLPNGIETEFQKLVAKRL